jgi:hypothetical protein
MICLIENFSVICGVSALSSANMKAFSITLIVNATKEVPNLKALGEIQRMKLWVVSHIEL